MRHVGDAVVLEHEPRPQLALRPRDFVLGDAVAATGSIAASAASSSAASGTPSLAVNDSV